ncbi:MAG TPA: hypothetical protein VK459_20985, partial [Polyangiaceae bacterium]|nr:hypothetical protein [Polyangiaceae bacterium]
KDALDGDLLPGGKDAEMDVRVEHRRKKQMKLRDETTLCRLFQAPPAQIAALRRRLGLLRNEDLQRAGADIISYAVGVSFGRWDIRLWKHPEWIPTFADPFDPMPSCPLGQLVNQEGHPATEDRIASEDWLAARSDPNQLPQGPYGSFEVDASKYPLAVAWNGIIYDDTLHDLLPRRPAESFIARIEAVLEHLFGAARSDWEHDLAEALGVPSISAWLRVPGGFFADHLARYSKSRRQAPIYWPLSTPSGGLTVWIYAPRFNAATLPLLANRLRSELEDLRDARDRLDNPKTTGAELDRLAALKRAIEERQAFRGQLEEVLRWEYEPHPDDGFVITASPLHFAFRLPKWRDLLKTTWDELEKGAYDWAHLAMKRRPAEVLAACKRDRSLAIAHGKEDLYEAPEEKKRGRKPSTAGRKKTPAGAQKQTSIRGVEREEEE